MKVLDEHTKFAHLGKPGSAFSKGFQRRLDMILKKHDLNGKKILDLGTGEGVWLREFAKYTDPKNVFGSEYDKDTIEPYISQITQSGIPTENIKICPGERLEFPDQTFDVVFQNEVLEHVQDDKKVLEECYRVLKPGGVVILFTPNAGWPFETHGMFFRGKYYWGNIPFLPWMPNFIYKKFAPHVRNYTNWDLRKKLKNSGFEIQHHSHIFPGFDGLQRKYGFLGKLVKSFFHLIEKTPLHFFGISHFVIAKKI